MDVFDEPLFIAPETSFLTWMLVVLIAAIGIPCAVALAHFEPEPDEAAPTVPLHQAEDHAGIGSPSGT